MKCANCGRKIENAYYINGIAYGYNCYKLKLALIYRQWEDERNKEYSAKCFSAMHVFKGKKSNAFHNSIVEQWNDCKKLTAKQLECIIKGFTFSDTIEFYKVWFNLANEENKKAISRWTITMIQKEQKFSDFVEDEAIHEIIKNDYEYIGGFHFYHDTEIEPEKIYICQNGKYIKNKETKERTFDNYYLKENQEDEYIVIDKIINGGTLNV